MAAGRKLANEVEKTLKKTEEGIEEFDALWEKVRRGRAAKAAADEISLPSCSPASVLLRCLIIVC